MKAHDDGEVVGADAVGQLVPLDRRAARPAVRHGPRRQLAALARRRARLNDDLDAPVAHHAKGDALSPLLCGSRLVGLRLRRPAREGAQQLGPLRRQRADQDVELVPARPRQQIEHAVEDLAPLVVPDVLAGNEALDARDGRRDLDAVVAVALVDEDDGRLVVRVEAERTLGHLEFIDAEFAKAEHHFLRSVALRQERDGSLVFETHDPDGVKVLFRQGD